MSFRKYNLCRVTGFDKYGSRVETLQIKIWEKEKKKTLKLTSAVEKQMESV